LSLLSNLDFVELAAENSDGFVAISSGLTGVPDRLRGPARRDARARMTAARIADGTGLARAIQESYRVMWRRWCEGRSG